MYNDDISAREDARVQQRKRWIERAIFVAIILTCLATFIPASKSFTIYVPGLFTIYLGHQLPPSDAPAMRKKPLP